MIRRVLIAVALAACGLTAHAQTSARVDRQILSKYDLDTPTVTATTNYIVTSVNLTSVALTLAHQPDTPRNFTGTVTDTTPSVVAGTVTFVGTDVNGVAQSEVWNFATALTFTGTKVFATLTSATVAGATVLGGSGDETIVVGVGTTVAYRYCVLGTPQITGTGGRIKTASSSTTVTAVTGTPFDLVAVGDQIQATGVESGGGGTRTITAKASGASITVDSAIDLSATGGYAWMYRTLSCGYGDNAGWFKLQGFHATVGLVIRQRTATGGIDVSIEGRQNGSLGPPIQLVSGNFTGVWVDGQPVGTTAGNTWDIEEAMGEIRVGLKFGTTDDSSDSGTEQVDVALSSEEKR